ncbi:MAG TPA: hypothetical protein VGG05_25180 [Pseudonocardiaceae bacterium]|jgi:phage shock protein A
MSQSPDEPAIEDAEVVDGAALALPGPIAADEPVTDYTDDGTPTFDYVRNQIEGRIAMSIGTGELAGATPEAATLDEQFTAREEAGRERLEQIRRSMRQE